MTGPDGMPASWRHYRWGLDHIERSRNRRRLGMAGAMRAAQSKDRDYTAWRRDHQVAGSC